MDLISILQLFGGVGLFLYGMSLMSSSLEKLAGGGLEKVLEKVTTGKSKATGRLKGWFFGTAVTAIIQSSAAVTIMLCGFVNAGIMKLGQAIPVVFGSNVGSTVTAQILRIGDLGSDNLILKLVKPSSFAPMLVGTGAFIMVFSKKKNLKNVAGILCGLGMLFYGMTLMEAVFEPLRESAEFRSFFTSFSNPLIGLIAGLLITAVIQSSSAAVGILQALSATGSVTYAITIPMVIGINIGKCMPIVLGMLGANKKAKKVSLSYLFFNIFGAAFFMIIIYSIYYSIGIPAMANVVNRGNIANVHLIYNVATSFILLLMSDKVADICSKMLGEEETKEQDLELAKLDDMLLNTPAIALEQCKEVITRMGEAIVENYNIATDMIYKYDFASFPVLEENEAFIDKCETALSNYIVRIDRKRLTNDDKLVVSEILNSISDFERMGDYCMNIAYVAQDKNEKDIHFSPYGHRETEMIISAVKYTLDTTFKSFKNDDASLAVRVEPLSETIDKLKEIIKAHHVDRLQDGNCSIAGGVSLFDLINSFERISSHCSNVALHVIKRVGGDRDFDEMHGHANDSFSEEYKALYHYYESQFVDPVMRPMTEAELQEVLANRETRKNAVPGLVVESETKQEHDEKSEKTEKLEKDKHSKIEKHDGASESVEKPKMDKESKDKHSKESKEVKNLKDSRNQKQKKSSKNKKK